MKKLLSLFLALALWAGLGIPASAAGFSDVPANSPFAPAIAWAVEQGVTKGTTPTTFGPGNTCTTSHILTFLWRAAGRPGDAGDERAAVSAWASGLGIGVSDLSAPCTRAAAVTDIWKAQGSPAAKTAAFFADVDPSAPYAGAVSWAVEAGVTNGTGGGAFSPESVCTRGQIVTFLYRAMGDKGTVPAEVPKEVEKPAQGGSGTLSNGKAITEENVRELLQELKAKYPTETLYAPVGTKIYTKIYYQTPSQAGSGTQCAGWAALASDYIFGKNGHVETHKNFDNMRPGDVLYSKPHKSLIIGRTTCESCNGTAYITSDSGSDYKVYWGEYSMRICSHCHAQNLKDGFTVITRYPTDVPQYNPVTGGNDSNSTPSDTGTSTEPSAGTGSGNTGTNSADWAIWSANKSCDLCGATTGPWVLNMDRTKHICSNCDKTAEGRNYIS